MVVLALCAPSFAALYKWTDANGRVVYSDQPPTGDVKTAVIAAPSAPANPNAVKEMANKEADFKKRLIDQSEGEKKSEKQRTDSARLTEVCSRARLQSTQLGKEDAPLYRLNAKGDNEAMDVVARRRERENVEKWMKDNKCPPA